MHRTTAGLPLALHAPAAPLSGTARMSSKSTSWQGVDCGVALREALRRRRGRACSRHLVRPAEGVVARARVRVLHARDSSDTRDAAAAAASHATRAHPQHLPRSLHAAEARGVRLRAAAVRVQPKRLRACARAVSALRPWLVRSRVAKLCCTKQAGALRTACWYACRICGAVAVRGTPSTS